MTIYRRIPLVHGRSISDVVPLELGDRIAELARSVPEDRYYDEVDKQIALPLRALANAGFSPADIEAWRDLILDRAFFAYVDVDAE